MTRLSQLRSQRDARRSRRAINRAIADAASTGMRNELIYVAQRDRGFYAR